MNEFILNLDNIIKDTEKKFNHATRINVHETKWKNLSLLLERLAAYKQILFPLAWGNLKQIECQQRYEAISKLYDTISECRSNMLPDVNKDYEASQEIRIQTKESIH